jgi:CheY-like chemotaxis protein
LALKVLLADDSMTAQNMGKKILAEAGFEVVAVSNGAAAVKKIASEKPDVVVLDVYMPGYTGLEVCERLRGAQETSMTPVLLTYGKMEAFDPGEADRVKANGVIVKPFEASDLLAAVQKLAEKAAPPPPPQAEETTVKMAVPSFVQEFKDSSYEEWKSTADEHMDTGAVVKERIEVPNEMAASPAMGWEEPATHSAPEPRTTVPDMRSTVALDRGGEAATPPAPEPMRHVEDHQIEPTSAPRAGEVEIQRDPGLVTEASEMVQFATKFGVEHPEVIPVGVYTPPPEPAAAEAPPAEAEAAAPPPAATPKEDEFQKAVNAAMAAYEAPAPPQEAAPMDAGPAAPVEEAAPAEAPPAPAPGWAAEETKVEEHEHKASLEQEMQQAFASVPVETAPAAEPEPPPPAPPPAPAPAVGDETEVLAAEMAAAMASKIPEAAAAPPGTTSLDSATIARIVHAAMEKLKPELEAEIARALQAEQERSRKS